MSSKYVDVTAITQVIGNIFNNVEILDNTEKYSITDQDFVEEFHRVVFGSIYNLHKSGSGVSIDSIIDYLANRPKFDAIFKTNKGIEYLTEASQIARQDEFNYYYSRLKKFSLLRAYDNIGMDVSFIYDPINIIDTKRKQEQEDWLDNASLSLIADIIDKKISDIRLNFAESDIGIGYQAGEGIFDLIERFKKQPDVGIPLYGPYINTVTRGARLGKVYLRSGATGQGKTRSMVADSANFACNRIYHEQFGWIKNGISQPTVYITTEQDLSEVQQMLLAFLSEVDEDHIVKGQYLDGEEERVLEAAKIIQESPLWIECVPDFSMRDIENIIKRYIKDKNVKYIVYDYIMTTLKILAEITKQTNGVKLREDNILFMLSTRLKDLANKYGVFIMTSTQLSGNWRESDTPDQSLLRGAKSIADKVDCAMILLPVSDEDLEKLEPILASNINFQTPNLKISVYKNRGGAYKGIYLWAKANLGVCRIHPQFCTTWNHSLVGIEDIKIIVDEDSAPWEK